MAMHGRRELLAMMGLAKAPPPPGSQRMDQRQWEAFKHRHNMRYQYIEDQKRRKARRDEGGGNG